MGGGWPQRDAAMSRGIWDTRAVDADAESGKRASALARAVAIEMMRMTARPRIRVNYAPRFFYFSSSPIVGAGICKGKTVGRVRRINPGEGWMFWQLSWNQTRLVLVAEMRAGPPKKSRVAIDKPALPQRNAVSLALEPPLQQHPIRTRMVVV